MSEIAFTTHARQRFKERFGVPLNMGLCKMIQERLESKKYKPLVGTQPPFVVAELDLHGIQISLVYNEKQGRVTTILPRKKIRDVFDDQHVRVYSAKDASQFTESGRFDAKS